MLQAQPIVGHRAVLSYPEALGGTYPVLNLSLFLDLQIQ